MAKILIVDDDQDIRELLKDVLVNSGNIVVVAKDGVDGYEAWKRDIFDLAIIDVDMPRRNGIDLTRDLKNAMRDFPVILITAYAHLYNASEILLLGVEAFLKKPIDLESLLAAVERIKVKS